MSSLDAGKFFRSWVRRKRPSQTPEPDGLLDKKPFAELPQPILDVVSDPEVALRTFSRLEAFFEQNVLRTQVFGTNYRVEKGRLPEGMRYFFVAPWNSEGWLFEAFPKGWSISLAGKIVERQTFLRSATSWDQVTLLEALEEPGKLESSRCLRIDSTRFGPDLMTFPIYSQALIKEMSVGE